MRARQLTFVLGLAIVAALFVAFIGCSDDSTSTTGSNSDPNFLAVQDEINDMIDSTIGFFYQGLSNLSGIDGGDNIEDILYGPGDPEDQTTVSYNNTTGWHSITILRSTTGYQWTIEDLIQFRNAAGNFQQYGTNAAALTYDHRWSRTATNTDVTHTNLEGRANFVFDGLDGDEVTIDGIHQWQAYSKLVSVDSTVERTIVMADTLQNFTVAKGAQGWYQNNCPSDGTVDAGMTMTYVKDDGTPVTTQWQCSITFQDGAASVQVQQGATIWNYNRQVCTETGTD